MLAGTAMPSPLLVSFVAGSAGPWRVERIQAVCGDALPNAERLSVLEGRGAHEPSSSWILRGITSNTRYTNRAEVDALSARQPGLGRPEASCAALIPIRKTDAWWALAQDERRAILEEQSRHIAVGLQYLPAVARRLHHSRELGEPFDFLTWFEFAPEHAVAFEELVSRLRATPEWSYVDREVDVRLVRVAP
jgi:chlorite dismutase